jgi:argininosuccinate lyase
MKLWNKENTNTSKLVESFTVGRDKEFDILLAEYDVLGSLAHTEMLASVGLLSGQELESIKKELSQILETIRNGHFIIDEHVEDVHSQIEWMLTQKIGDAGKKIHSGRSRNDQVAVDIKLFLRTEILKIRDEAKKLFDLLIAQSEKFKDKLLPGYTHLQVAMPSLFGLCSGAYGKAWWMISNY